MPEKLEPKVEMKPDDLQKTLEEENLELHKACTRLTTQVQNLQIQAELFEIQSDLLNIINNLTELSNKILRVIINQKKGA